MPIVLKDRNSADVTFKQTGSSLDGVVYDASGSNLIDRKRLTLRIVENKATFRIHTKLSVPTVCATTEQCEVPSVLYTQVASSDITVVKTSTLTDRKDLVAFLSSLASSDAFSAMIVDASLPRG